jgi:excisionase family DNA binding protein
VGKQKRVENDAPLQSLLSIADLCRVLNLSRPKIYDLIREGLPIIRFGRAVRVSPLSLQRWLARREEIA